MSSTELKKTIRRSSNKVTLGVILYSLINFIIICIDLIINDYGSSLDTQSAAGTETVASQIPMWSTIIAVIIGIVFLFFYSRDDRIEMFKFEAKNKMTLNSFMKILCVFMGIQLVFTMFSIGLESVLGLFGLTAMEEMNSATEASGTVSMFIYASLVAPIGEEIIYRGFVMRSMERYGKVLAIVFSAIVFGVMHGNLHQIFFAFTSGLVLGFVAMNYSIKWSIALHMINNCIFGDLLQYITGGLPSEVSTLITWIINFGFFAVGMWVIIKNKSKIRDYIRNNKPVKRAFIYSITSLAMIIFIIIEFLIAFSGVSAI